MTQNTPNGLNEIDRETAIAQRQQNARERGQQMNQRPSLYDIAFHMDQPGAYRQAPSTEPMQAPENNQGFFGDAVDAIQMGAAQAAGGLAETAHQITGSEMLGNASQALNSLAKDQINQMSDAGQAAMQKQFFTEDENGMGFGDAWTDPRAAGLQFLTLIGQMGAQIPLGYGIGTLGAKVAGKIVATSAAKHAAGRGMSEEAIKHYAQNVTRATFGTAGQSLAGAGIAGGMIGNEARTSVLEMSDDELDQSPAFSRAYYSMVESHPDIDVGQRRDLAKKMIADEVAAAVQRDPMLITTNLVLDAAGGYFIDRILRGVGTGSRLSNAGQQFLAQGSTEMGQGSMEQYALNTAMIEQDVDPTRDPMEGVISNGLNEAVLGGGMGLMMGAARKGKPSENKLPGRIQQVDEEGRVMRSIDDGTGRIIEPTMSRDEAFAQVQAERGQYRGIDDDIRIAEQQGFTDEAVRLRAAKRNYEVASELQAEGDIEGAQRFRERGNKIYRDVMEVTDPQYKGGLPAEYVADGEIVERAGQFPAPVQPQGETVDGQATRVVPPTPALQHSTKGIPDSVDAPYYMDTTAEAKAAKAATEQAFTEQQGQTPAIYQPPAPVPKENVEAIPYQKPVLEQAADSSLQIDGYDQDGYINFQPRDSGLYDPTKPPATDAEMEQDLQRLEQAAKQAKQSENTTSIQAENGRKGRVKIGDKYEPVTFQLVDLAKNPQLAPTMQQDENQPRDRKRFSSNQQINKIAKELDFNELGESPRMSGGAPTITNDGKIIGGNGRTAAVRQAYANGTAENYRNELKARAREFGLTPAQIDGMEQPVLVRRLQNPVDVVKAAIQSNDSGTMNMSPLEQARADSKLFGRTPAIELDDNGAINWNSPNNQPALKGFIAAIPQNEQNSMLDGRGFATPEAKNRFARMLMYRAFGNSRVLSNLIEDTSESSRNLLAALESVSPRIAVINQQMAEGTLHRIDISDYIVEAVELLESLRISGRSVADYINQLDMVSVTSPTTNAIAAQLEENIRSRNALLNQLNGYYDAIVAAGHPDQGNLFGAEVPTLEEITGASRYARPEASQSEGARRPGLGVERTPAPEEAQTGADSGFTGAEPQAAGADSGAEVDLLTPYSEQDIAQREAEQAEAASKEAAQQKAAEQKARADSEALDFTLSGSDLPADIAASRGQNSLFDAGGEPAAQDKEPAQTPADAGVPVSDAAIRNSAGKPFKNIGAARIALKKYPGYEIAKVDGGYELHQIPEGAATAANGNMAEPPRTGALDMNDELSSDVNSDFPANVEPEQVAKVRRMTANGQAADGKPIMPGDVFQTVSGRVTTPYPKQKSAKYSSQWLIDNATAEAMARGNGLAARNFENAQLLKGGELTTADLDSMNQYLFDPESIAADGPGGRSILKPLNPAGTKDAKQSAEPKDWHTPLPDEGLALTPIQRDGKPEAHRGVTALIAADAYDSMTRVQLTNGQAMSLYYLPESNGRNGAARLIPDGQPVPSAWRKVEGGELSVGAMTREQAVRRITDLLSNAEVIGSPVNTEKPISGSLSKPANKPRSESKKPESDKQDKPLTIDDINRESLESAYDVKKATQAYSHSVRSPGVPAKMHRDDFVNTILDTQKDLQRIAKSDQQKTVLDSEIVDFANEYLKRDAAVLAAREGVASSFIAGRNKFNGKQANARGNAVDRAQDSFSSWVKSRQSEIRNKVLSARTPEEIEAERAELKKQLDDKQQKREQSEAEIMKKAMQFKPGDEWKFGGYQVKRVTKGRDGNPVSVIVDAPMGELTSNTFNLKSIVFKGDDNAYLAAIERARADIPAESATPAALPDNLPPHEAVNALMRRLNGGEAVPTSDVLRVFESVVADPDATKAALGKLKKAELMDHVRGHVYSDTKKDQLVRMAYNGMVQSFRFIGNNSGVVTWSHGENVETLTREHIKSLSDADIATYAADRKAMIDEKIKATQEYMERLKNPETLEDYRRLVQVKGIDSLTVEQRATYDRLTAEKALEEKPVQAVKKGLDTDGEIQTGEPEEGRNSKTGETIFNVKVIDRLGTDKFKEAAAFARRMKGGYWKGNFYFPSVETAQQFRDWLNGKDIDLTEQVAQRLGEKKARAAARLKQMANRMKEAAEAELNTTRRANTIRQADMAASAVAKAEGAAVTAEVMRRVANGEAPLLSRMTEKVQAELLARYARGLVHNAPADLTDRDNYSNRFFKADVTPEQMVSGAEMPLDSIHPSQLAYIASDMEKKKGFKQAAASLRTLIRGAGEDKRIALNDRARERIMDFASKHGESHTTYTELANQRKRLERMGITSLPVLRAALVEYINLKNSIARPKKNNRLDDMEQALKRTVLGNRNAFNDFFPTPNDTAAEVVELADIQPGMAVLEPSAGNGMLADAIKDAGGNVDVVEMAGQLREILQEKGHNLIGNDFLELPAGEQYDRIVMNPPFSKNQDIDHVTHAYSMLKPGGRIVAIVSSMAGERSDGKNKAFRDFLNAIAADEQALPDGAFKSSLNPTGVSTKVLIIDKPENGGEGNQGETGTSFSRSSLGLSGNSNKVTSSDKSGAGTAVGIANAGEGVSPLSVAAIERIIGRTIPRVKNQGNYRIFDDVSDLFEAYPAVKKSADKQGSDGSDIGGVWHDGKILLVRNKITRPVQVESLIFHEATHGGVKAMLADTKISQAAADLFDAMGGTKGFIKIMDELGLSDKLKPYMKGVTGRNADGSPKMDRRERSEILVHELLAFTGEKVSQGVRQKARELLGAIRNWLRKNGFASLSQLSVADISYFAKVAREYGLGGELGREQTLFLRAYHGTPHTFDRFSLRAIGSGEGIQAYGWGLYFASNRAVAEYYRDAVSGLTVDGRTATSDETKAFSVLKDNNNDIAAAVDDGRRDVERAGEYMREIVVRRQAVLESWAKKMPELSSSGNLYQVDIPEESSLLDYDKPISQQPEQVRRNLLKLKREMGDLYPLFSESLEPLEYGNTQGNDLYRALVQDAGSPEQASRTLNNAGIPGLKYADAGSRYIGAGDGSSNYVIWDDRLVSVEAVNDEVRQANALFSLPRDNDPDLQKAIAGRLKEMAQIAKEKGPTKPVDRSDTPPMADYVRKWIAGVEAGLGVKIEVVETKNELPESVKADLGSAFNDVEFEGFYNTANGRTYLIASNLTSPAAAVRAALHEALGHGAVINFIQAQRKKGGKALGQVLDDIYRQIGKKLLLNKIQRYGFDLTNEMERREAVLEYIAHVAEEGKKMGMVRRVVAALRDFIRKVFPGIGWNDTDTLALIAKSKLHLQQEGARGISGMNKVIRRDSDDTGKPGKPQTETAAFRKWFGDSKVVDAEGKPLVVYRGLGAPYEQGADREITWVTPDVEYASQYATGNATPVVDNGRFYETGANVLPLYVSIKRPFDLGFRSTMTLVKYSDVLDRIDGAVQSAFERDVIGSDEGIALMREIEALQKQDTGEFKKVHEWWTQNAEQVKGLLERAGYDGIKSREGFDDRIPAFGAFRPEQIKSAIGNNGNFDGSNPNILFRLSDALANDPTLTDKQKRALSKIGPKSAAQTAMDRVRDTMTNWRLKVRQGLVDRYAGLLELDKQLLNGNVTSEENITKSAWVKARMSNAAGGAVSAMMNAGRIALDADGVIDVKKDTSGLIYTLNQLGSAAEVERFMGWIAGNRGEKLMAEGRENLFTPEDIAALKDLNTGTMPDGRDRNATYENVFAEFQQHRDDVLAIAEKAGIITSENREMWANEFYVPFYRLDEEAEQPQGPRIGGGLSRQQAYKKLKGGTQNLNDLLQNTIMNFHHLLDASLKNMAATQAVDNALELGVVEQTTEATRDKKQSTFVLRNGEKVWYDVADPLVFQALTSLNPTGMNSTAMKVMRWFKRTFTNLTTSTPQFIVANLIRDSLSAISVTDLKYNAAGNVVQGLKSFGLSDRTSYQRARLMASGGGFSFGHAYGEDAEFIRYQIDGQMRRGKVLSNPKALLGHGLKPLQAAWDRWQDVNNSFENANRMAAFEQAEAAGKGKLYAAFQARDLMDFSASGAWPAVRFLIDVVPFLNARLQGLDKLYRSGVKPTTKVVMQMLGVGSIETSVTERQAAARFSAVVAALSVATMALYLRNQDDEDYQKAEDWMKDTYWWVRIPGTQHVGLIPKPFEVGAIATLTERLLEQAVNDKATGALFRERLWHMMGSTFAFSPVPQMLQPAFDVYANRDSFTGRDIETMGQQRLSPSNRVNDRTTLVAEMMGTGLETAFGPDSMLALSPVQIDYLISGYFGQVGAWMVGHTDVLKNTLSNNDAPARHWYEYQPIRRFYRNMDDPQSDKQTTLFYESLRDAARLHADLQQLKVEGNYAEAAELQRENKDILAGRLTLDRVNRKVTAINARIKAIKANQSLSADEKRRQIDLLQLRKKQLIERVMPVVEKSRQ